MNKFYFLQRIAEIGLSEAEARKHGLSYDKYGNILQQARTYDGGAVYYLPELTSKAKQALKRKTFSNIGEKEFSMPYQVRRLTPEALVKTPDLPKYLSPKNTPPRPLPTNLAIKHYQDEKKGGTVYFTEGYFKALVMSLYGLEATAFLGINLFKLCAEIWKYLERRQPDRIVFIFDGDAKDLSKKELSTRRPRTFLAGAVNFAKALFDFQETTGQKFKVFFAALQPDAPGKGIDDVLQVLPNKADLLEALESRKTSSYFEFIKLSKTTHEKKLKAFFKLDNYQHFYHYHQDEIKEAPFGYFGATYQVRHLDDLFNNTEKDFILKTDPFHIDTRPDVLEVKQYLNEAWPELRDLLNNVNRLAIDAPTGSGKTTFILEYAKKTGKKIVLAVPTVGLVKQLSSSSGKIYGLHGNLTPGKQQSALKAQMVVCTYDTLKGVRDLFQRVLIVDEAHNLINQVGEVYKGNTPFRLETLQAVVSKFEEAKRVVLLSGTMPELLCSAFEFQLVRVKQKEFNRIRLFKMESNGSRPAALTSSLISKLTRTDFSQQKVNFIFYNNLEQLEAVRTYLIENNILEAHQIEVISRPTYELGENEIFDQITRHQEIKKDVRLILTTCIIAEGVNIKNTNIGNVWTVGINCPDLFRQFVARFRKMKTLNVFSILPKETDLQIDFFIPAREDLEEDISTAATLAKSLQKTIEKQYNELDFEELERYEAIDQARRYKYHSNNLKNVYFDELTSSYQVDQLRILAGIKQRQLNAGNNCYFYSQLAKFENIQVYSSESLTESTEISDSLKAVQQDIKEKKEVTLTELKKDLEERPEIVLGAMYQHYQTGKNRHGMTFLKTATGTTEDTRPDVLDYYQTHKELFKQKWFTRMVLDYCKMTFAGLTRKDISHYLEDYKEGRFAKDWNTYKTQIEFLIYDSKRKRKHLNTLHRADIKGKKMFAEHISRLQDKKDYLTEKDIQKIYQQVFSVPTSAGLQPIGRTTTGKIEALLSELFQLEKVKSVKGTKYKNFKKWNIENVPFFTQNSNSLIHKPLKYLELYEKRE